MNFFNHVIVESCDQSVGEVGNIDRINVSVQIKYSIFLVIPFPDRLRIPAADLLFRFLSHEDFPECHFCGSRFIKIAVFVLIIFVLVVLILIIFVLVVLVLIVLVLVVLVLVVFILVVFVLVVFVLVVFVLVVFVLVIFVLVVFFALARRARPLQLGLSTASMGVPSSEVLGCSPVSTSNRSLSPLMRREGNDARHLHPHPGVADGGYQSL